MPRKPRIEQIGYHHIINRGVAKTTTFYDDEDYEKFLSFVSIAKSHYGLTLHSFCLMPNHYHLLIEIFSDNLSLIMRQINSQYAQYFNKKYDRVGPLWQGRYKNYYVYDEKYLNALLRYIEQNPVKANIVDGIGKYRYCSTFFIQNNEDKDLLKGSLLENIKSLSTLGKELNKKEREDLANLEKTKFIVSDATVKRAKEKELSEYFKKDMTKKNRNEKILLAIKDGYRQSEIAEFLQLTRAAVSMIANDYK
jgi:putative transposase